MLTSGSEQGREPINDDTVAKTLKRIIIRFQKKLDFVCIFQGKLVTSSFHKERTIRQKRQVF